MLPLRIVETEREDFDEPVVELWRADEFIGMVFWDDDTPVVQIYADDDGDVKDIDVRELLRVLDLAEQIVSPIGSDDEFAEIRSAIQVIAGDDAAPTQSWDDEDPAVAALMREFDSQAAHRTEDGEGFFRTPIAKTFIERCNEFDLAVVEMEGFDLQLDDLIERPNQSMVTRVGSDATWAIFRPSANMRANDTLAGWRDRETLVIAFVIQLPNGDTVVA